MCLDKTNISPSAQRQVEPCDIYTIRDGRARMIHVKISTDAPAMSHLFNQGANSIELLKSEQQARDKLIALIVGKCAPEISEHLCSAIPRQDFEVTYAIITHKPGDKMSANLPLFSRISLRRNIRSLELMGAVARFGFIDDSYARSSGRKKPRKSRKKKSDDSA